MRERKCDQDAIPGANESPTKDLGSRRGVDYERVALPGEILPERHDHAGRAILPAPTEYRGTASDRGVVRYRSRKPKRVFTQSRKLGQRAMQPVFAKILGAFTGGLSVEAFVAEATARGKPTKLGQRRKEMLSLFVQMMRELGYAPAAIQKLTGLSPSQVTRLSAHELPGLRAVAARVDWPQPIRQIDGDTYTAPRRHEHPAHRARFGANQSRSENDLTTLDMLDEKVAALEAKVSELRAQSGVLAANQVEQADGSTCLRDSGSRRRRAT